MCRVLCGHDLCFGVVQAALAAVVADMVVIMVAGTAVAAVPGMVADMAVWAVGNTMQGTASSSSSTSSKVLPPLLVCYLCLRVHVSAPNELGSAQTLADELHITFSTPSSCSNVCPIRTVLNLLFPFFDRTKELNFEYNDRRKKIMPCTELN